MLRQLRTCKQVPSVMAFSSLANSSILGEQERPLPKESGVCSWEGLTATRQGIRQDIGRASLVWCAMTNADNSAAYVVGRRWIIRYESHDNG